MFHFLIKSWLSFSRRERRGILVLLALITVLFLFRYALPGFIREDVSDLTEFREEVEAFQKQIQPDENRKPVETPLKIATPIVLHPFYFDPNTLSPEGWKRLGVEDKTIRVIGNYLARGGRFRQKEDLQKIYGFKKEWYERLASYIQIRQDPAVFSPASFPTAGNIKRNTDALIVDINSADSSQLIRLPGIGPVLSRRIVSFREKLGGFYRVEQVQEVYGLSDSVFQRIKVHLTIGDSLLRKININTADVNTLKQHPYISYQLANVIVQFRRQHGVFGGVEDLFRITLVDDEIYLKIAPYLVAD